MQIDDEGVPTSKTPMIVDGTVELYRVGFNDRPSHLSLYPAIPDKIRLFPDIFLVESYVIYVPFSEVLYVDTLLDVRYKIVKCVLSRLDVWTGVLHLYP